MMLRNLLLVGLTLILTGATGPTWEHWRTIPGIFDVAGPRQDGSLVVAGNGLLYLVDPSGNVSSFAREAQGYAGEGGGAESYLTVSTGHAVSAAGCSFTPDDVFVLRLHAPRGITRIDGQGRATPFATVTGVESLNGIAFDTTGSFGFRLLVSGTSKGKTAIAAIDCKGAVTFITQTAPTLEGGLAVAPAGFGSFAGDLIAPDEYSGNIYAIAPDGTVRTVAASGLAAGPDTGVESVAFVPKGFAPGGEAYYADRATPTNPHPGSDSLLRLSAANLSGAAVHEGDLLAATEGGATMIDVACQPDCRVLTIVGTTSTSHGEGHLVIVAGPVSKPTTSPVQSRPASPPAPNREPLLILAVLVAIGLAAAASLLAARRGTKRGS
jgi:hypothetical protein